jgi:hypothetical protein
VGRQLRTVAVRRRAGEARPDVGGQPGEQPADLLGLQRKLIFVSEVLILAAAASPEVTAPRLDALRRGREDPQQFCASETFLYFGDLGFDLFAVRDERNEHHEILPARDALAAEGDVFDFQIQFLAGRQLHEPNLEICVP